jgi:hypothetical protein
MAQRRPAALSDDRLFADWVRWIERVYDETVRQGWRHRMFRLMRGIYEQNPELQDTGGFFITWAADNYVAAAAMALRRELDSQPGTENLLHLLEEMRDRPTVISRSRYRASWGDAARRQEADRGFDSLPIVRKDNQENDHIDPKSIVADLDVLAAQDLVLTHVQTTVAHRAPPRPDARIPTFGEFHGAFDAVRDVVQRYYMILTHRVVVTFEPLAQYNVYTPFRSPWITDSEKFDYTRTE